VNEERGLAQPAPATDRQQTGRRGTEDDVELLQFSHAIDQHGDILLAIIDVG
jgi:hypothetical protein